MERPWDTPNEDTEERTGGRWSVGAPTFAPGDAPYTPPTPYFLWWSNNVFNRSIGTGKTMVEALLAATSVRVWS